MSTVDALGFVILFEMWTYVLLTWAWTPKPKGKR